MKMTTVREFRNDLAEMMNEAGPVIITRHGKPAGLFIPWKENSDLPLEIKRDAFKTLGKDLAKRLKGVSELEILKNFAQFRKNRRRRR